MSNKKRKYSNEFMSIGVDAAALGMSNAVTASTADVNSGYWNPAGLTSIQSPLQIGAMHAEWFAGVAKFDYGAFAKTLNPNTNSVLGISIIRFGIDNIPNTLSLYNSDGTTQTNLSGGIQGGISNGMDIYFRVAFKPVATIMQKQESLDNKGNISEMTGKGRHDPCVVPRAVPIVEAMAAIVLADFYLINKTYL